MPRPTAVLAAPFAVVVTALLGCRSAPQAGEGELSAAPTGSARAASAVDPVASKHAPSGLYRIEIERVRDTCDPPRRTGAASPAEGMPSGAPAAATWALPGGQHGTHGWMLNVPLVTLRPPGSTGPAGLARMDLLIAPGPARTSTRALGAGCPGLSATDTYEFAGYTDDGFRIRHVEEWPDASSCSAKPPEAPAAACRSERVMAFHIVEACDAACSLRVDPSRVDGPKESCQCPEGRTAAPTPRQTSAP